MYAKLVGSIGLLLDLVGVILLFKYGFPQPDFSEDVGLALPDTNEYEGGMTVGDFARIQRKKKEVYKRISICSLVLIIFGAIVQGIALWM